jgi:hypothetical protein
MHPLSVNQENKKYSNYSLTALGLMPFSSRAARMKQSMSVRGHVVSFTAGTGGFVIG